MSKTESLRSGRQQAFRIALTLFGLSLLAWFTWKSHDELTRLLANCSLGWLAISIVLGAAFTGIHALLFASFVAKHGDQVGARALVSAYLFSQPGKYIPGKVWSLIVQSIILDHRSRISHIAIANVELAVVSTLQVLVLGMALLCLDSPMLATLVLLIGLNLCGIVSVLPLAQWLLRLVPRLSAVVGLDADPAETRRLSMGRSLGLNAASMTSNLVASWCVLLAVGIEIPDADLVPILACLYLSIAVSILAIPVPAGIGVREAATVAIASMIAPTLSTSTIISVALLFRGWQILTDVVCTFLGAIIGFGYRGNSPKCRSRS